MSHRCLEPMELAALYGLPDDDPQRRAVADCPRCDSLLRAMTSFGEGNHALPEAERLRAEARLAKTLIDAMAGGSPIGTGAVSARSRAGEGRPAAGRVRRWNRAWGLGLAAVAAGVMLFAVRDAFPPAGPSGVLRGGASTRHGAASLTISVVDVPGQDRVSLSWPAVPGADSYRLELFTAALDTLAVFDPLPQPTVTIASALLKGSGSAEETPSGLLYRVRAFGAAGQIAATPLSGLDYPR